MPRYVAFLRAVNVGGAHTVKMAALCQAFEGMGFSAVSSYIASGNIIFTSPARNSALLEDRIEARLMETLGHQVIPFVRTTVDLERIAKFRPFPASRMRPADQLGILFLSAPLQPETRQALLALRGKSDEFRVEGREIYWLRHRGPNGEIQFTAPFDRVIDQPFTIRSASTTAKIVEKYCQHA
jgi:uncharacterized protein (DUF1697 family)